MPTNSVNSKKFVFPLLLKPCDGASNEYTVNPLANSFSIKSEKFPACPSHPWISKTFFSPPFQV